MSPNHATKVLAVLLSLAAAFFSGCGGRADSDAMHVDTSKKQADAFAALGASLMQQGDLAGAISELSKADALSPNNPKIINFLGLTFYKLQDFPKAIEHYNRALEIDPAKTEIHNNLGLVYMTQGDYERAKVEFRKCFDDQTYGNSHLPQFNLGVIAELQNQIPEAEAIYFRLINLRPQYDMPYYRLALISFKRGETRKALDFLLNSVRLNRENPDAFFLIGECYERLGNADEAAESYGQVVNLAPNTPLAIEAQGRARKVLGFE
ncbi:MAG: tetratricopeptide repeat protein [Deltaproteobacteria bacterium]|jgi:type IV pilus assembly protein PilF|nr:tetratricopeptide repeat protein [Deltaproteobacteria bacterium]